MAAPPVESFRAIFVLRGRLRKGDPVQRVGAVVAEVDGVAAVADGQAEEVARAGRLAYTVYEHGLHLAAVGRGPRQLAVATVGRQDVAVGGDRQPQRRV